MDDTKSYWEYPDMVAAGPYKASVEYEDHDVRIIRFKLGPGETMPMHRHAGRLDIMLTDVHSLTIQPNGYRHESRAKAGELGYSDPVVHEGHNLGDAPWEMIEIEFKQRAPAGFSNAWAEPSPVRVSASTNAATVSYAADIRPMFRDVDVTCMKKQDIDLSKYEDCKDNAAQIYEDVVDHTMPPDEPWPDDWCDRFQTWMQQNYPP